MKRTLFNYQFNKKYSLCPINIYAYSFFATKILINNEINRGFTIDLASIISHISDSLVEETNQELIDLRNENHEHYYKIDLKFLMNTPKRYKKIADKIMKNYTSLDPKILLKDNEEDALKHQKEIKVINLSIDKLREKMREDLLVIMDFVDEEEKQLDKSFLKDDNVLANKLKKRYDSLLLQKSVINKDNLNLEIKRQTERLSLIKQLKPLIKKYSENREEYTKMEYQIDDIMILRKNLSTIIGEYIFLLTHQEFHDVRKIYQGILDNNYSFIDDFLYTYKIIMDKVWKHMITPTNKFRFDFNYLVCRQDNLTSEVSVGLMNRSNMYNYGDIGYICKINGNIFDVLNVSKYELLNIKLPQDINEKYTFKIKEVEKVKIEVLYNKSSKPIYNDKYKVVEIS